MDFTLIPDSEFAEDNSPIIEFQDPDLEACLLTIQKVVWNGRTYVIQIDRNGDGKISQMEAEAVRVLALTTDLQNRLGKYISRFKGLEHFKNLEYLDISPGVSGLIYEMDASPFRFLRHFRCSAALRSLDVSQNARLEYLDCSGCGLTSLDVTNNRALKVLLCDYNWLPTLDVSRNTALKELVCTQNLLTALDVNRNKALTRLECNDCKLTSLDVSHNPALEILSCYGNALSSLDVSRNASLTNLSCDGNEEIASLDVSHNPALLRLGCSGLRLSTLDVSRNTQLWELGCGNNPELTAIDVSRNAQLKDLWCANCPISRLDLSQNPELVILSCYNTLIEHLDLGIQKKLQKIEPVNWNALSGLYINESLACPLKTLVLSREVRLIEHNMEVLAKVYPDLDITYVD